jgi:hypothetical protein
MLQRTLPAGFIAPCLPIKTINCPPAASGCTKSSTTASASTALYISCHCLHTEAVGSARQICGVSGYRGYRVTAKSANRIARTIQMLRRIAETSSASEHYEECIGAKKHLVTSPHAVPPSTSFATAGYVHWWKRSSGDGVAISAGIISLVRGR